MAPETSPPEGATRFIQTTRGLLTYSQLAPVLAERVLRAERDIATGAFGAQALDPNLILAFHAAIAADLCPDGAGRWRDADVRVGEHHPPPPHRVPMLMRDYGEDLRVRLENASGHMDDLLLETLAFAEGRLLSIHPFTDFNGRVIQAAWPIIADALSQVEAWKLESKGSNPSSPPKPDASSSAFTRFFRDTVNDETVPEGIPPAVPWEELEKKMKVPKQAKNVRGKLNVPRERFRLRDGNYLWAGGRDGLLIK